MGGKQMTAHSKSPKPSSKRSPKKMKSHPSPVWVSPYWYGNRSKLRSSSQKKTPSKPSISDLPEIASWEEAESLVNNAMTGISHLSQSDIDNLQSTEPSNSLILTAFAIHSMFTNSKNPAYIRLVESSNFSTMWDVAYHTLTSPSLLSLFQENDPLQHLANPTLLNAIINASEWNKEHILSKWVQAMI